MVECLCKGDNPLWTFILSTVKRVALLGLIKTDLQHVGVERVLSRFHLRLNPDTACIYCKWMRAPATRQLSLPGEHLNIRVNPRRGPHCRGKPLQP